MREEHYLEKTNKAFETAKLTSYWLYLAGIPEAIEYGKLILNYSPLRGDSG